MKKQDFKLSLVGGMLIAMTAVVNAQWTETGSAVYLTNGTKNVGIGTTTPAFALDLIRSGSANLSLKSTTGTSNLLLDRANSSATSSVSYRTNGVGTWQTGTVGTDNFNIRNIGLGNTALSISSANNNIGLGVGTALIILDTKAGQTIGTTATTGNQHASGNQGEKVSFGYVPSNASGEFVGMKAVVNPGTNFCGNSGDIYFNTWECNTSTSRPVMAINGTGNVGIGTTAPKDKLHINGGNLILDNSNQRFFVSGTPTWDISGGSSNYAIGRSGIDYPFVIDYASGNVGIGSTSPADKLTVQTGAETYGFTHTEGTVTVGSYIGTDPYNGLLGGWYGTKSDHPLYFFTNNNFAQLTLLQNNFFGVGTSSPTQLLDVNGNIQSKTHYVFNDANGVINFGNGTSGGLYFRSLNTAGDINSYNELAYLSNTGSFGLGTIPSYYKLEVSTSTSYGIRGSTTYSNGNGTEGICNVGTSAYGIYGESSTGYAGYFSGNVYCSGSYLPSDMRLKENIKPVENAMSLISKLEVKTYNYKDEYASMNLPKGNQYGFLAQQVEEVMPSLVKVTYDKTADKNNPFEFKAINYTGMIPLLVQTAQEQNTINEKLISENADLKSQIAAMNDCIQSLCNANATQKASSVEPQVVGNLFQNTPNPFNQTTVIRYALNSENTSGKIIIRDLNGNLVKQVNIANSGKGQVTINANELSAGTYTYTLEIAGASVDTKLMVVTK